MRILITGSRSWDDAAAIDNALWGHVDIEPENYPPIVVHGGCPSGADAIAHRLALHAKWPIEIHPANWARHGKGAGPIRNQRMVDLGADICLAFPKGESRGTRDCMRRAQAAGIPVVNLGDPDANP